MVCRGGDLASRRDLLKAGGFALGGLALPGIWAAPAFSAGQKLPVMDKCVVFLFMHGGPSQIETFDPKMTAPAGICSVNGETATSIAGVSYGSAFPKLGALAHRTAIVRSFTTGDANHDIKPIVGRATAGANLGSLYSRVAGTNRRRTGMPTNVALYPQAVDPSTRPVIKQFGDFESTGPLGGAYAPFAPSGGGDLKQDLQLHVPLNRIDDRRRLLTGLDRIRRAIDADGMLDGLRQQAFDTLLGSVADAFNLAKENPATVRRYDTAPLVRPEDVNKKWNNAQRYIDHGKSLGKLLLLARRLCERGAAFVTVTTDFVWDMHADVNNATMEEGLRYMAPPFDHAVSTFLRDVEERGLSEKILLVCCGEMGRTPRLNRRGGRDHWGSLAPLLLAGGGLKMGQVVGQSTRDAGEPLADPVTIPNLVATILNVLLDVGQVRVTPGIPREVLRAATGFEPIRALM